MVFIWGGEFDDLLGRVQVLHEGEEVLEGLGVTISSFLDER